MAIDNMKPHNTILFDFFSIIDVKLTVLKYIQDEYKNQKLDYFFQEGINKIDFDKSKLDRMKHLPRDLFSSVVHMPFKDQTEALKFAESLFYSREEDMLKHAVDTAMPSLINIYDKAGGGTVISCTVRCDNQTEVDYVKERTKHIRCIICPRKECDILKYSRIINGHWEHLMEYEKLIIPEDGHPRSLLLLNYDENFNDNEHKAVKYEVIEKFGIVHRIAMITAHN